MNCSNCRQPIGPIDPQWKCCPKHCTADGPDFICDNCAVRLHPEAAGIVRHKMFSPAGIMPCCGLHFLECVQTDQVTADDNQVTCTGKKRYIKKGETNGQPNRANRAERRAARRRR